MEDLKTFKKAVWEIRKKYMKPRLSKKELAEAFQLYRNVGENKERFKNLLKEVWITKGGPK